MKITIKDVAKAADVSIATVSRVINGKDKVKDETRLKIEQAVERLQFKPDMAARSMIIKQSKTIGFLVPRLGLNWWGTLADLLQDLLMEQGYTLFIGSDKEEESRQEQILHLFEERRVDGIIIGRAPLGTNRELIELYRKQGIPSVTMEKCTEEIPSETNGLDEMAREIVNILLQMIIDSEPPGGQMKSRFQA